MHDRAVELVEVGELVEERGDRGVGRVGHGRRSGVPRVRARACPDSPGSILPTYNEAENLEAIVAPPARCSRDALRRDGFRVLVVDDASPDGTGEIADALAAEHDEVEVLHRTEREGLGPAYLAGFRHALDRRRGLRHGDGRRLLPRPRTTSRGCSRRRATDADLVLGSRYVAGGGVADWGLLRRFVSRGGSSYARVRARPRGRATSRAASSAFAARCSRRSTSTACARSGYAFQVELTYRAVRAGFRVVEMPIVFRDRQHGPSRRCPGASPPRRCGSCRGCASRQARRAAVEPALARRRARSDRPMDGDADARPRPRACATRARRSRSWQRRAVARRAALGRRLARDRRRAARAVVADRLARDARPHAVVLRPALRAPASLGDVAHVLGRNMLVLALHAMRLRGRLHRRQLAAAEAERYSGVSRWVHDTAGPLAIAFVVVRHDVLAEHPGLRARAARARDARRPGRHLARRCCCSACCPTRVPELIALFLPLAAWIIASRRGEWEELLAATFVTIASPCRCSSSPPSSRSTSAPHVLLVAARVGSARARAGTPRALHFV